MTNLIGLNGQALGQALGQDYMEDLGARGGFTKEQRDFLRKNLPRVGGLDPEHMSASQRKIAALEQSAYTLGMQNMQLWSILGAVIEEHGEQTFSQPHLRGFLAPEKWPAVLVTPENDVRIAFMADVEGEMKGPDA